jgi:hypothetical protein
VVGPDVPVGSLSEAQVIDAVRCSKPLCAQYRAMLEDAGFRDVVVLNGVPPFVDGYRAGPVRGVVISARRS